MGDSRTLPKDPNPVIKNKGKNQEERASQQGELSKRRNPRGNSSSGIGRE